MFGSCGCQYKPEFDMVCFMKVYCCISIAWFDVYNILQVRWTLCPLSGDTEMKENCVHCRMDLEGRLDLDNFGFVLQL